jgi:enediyne biosynthesis protein E4
MGVGVGDYNGDGLLDIFKTNFSGDTSTLYRNLGVKSGLLSFDDVTFTAGIGVNTRYLGWGCGFVDFDNDGWLDIFLVNGHVYPEVEKLTTEAGYPQRKVLYQNQRDGSFKDIAEKIGGPLIEPTAGRGCAFGDFDNDGDIDVVINPVNDFPVLLRTDSATNNNWISIKLIGAKSNRDGVGARIKVIAGDRTQIGEVRSGGSYYSQNDMRVHFGLGKAAKAQTVEARWPSGAVDTLNDVAAGQVIFIKEGAGQIKPSTQNGAGQ